MPNMAMTVAWCRVHGNWLIVGKSVLRRAAQDMSESYPTKSDPSATRLVLPEGQHPYGPTTITEGEVPEFFEKWDGKVWPGKGSGQF